MKLKNLTYIITVSFLLSAGKVYATENQSWKFKVYLDEQEIGEHIFYVSKENNTKHVKIAADFNVNILFINAYNYLHTNHEIWSGQCLRSINSSTNDNGKHFFVQGSYHNEQLTIKTSSGQIKRKDCVKTFAYWDSEFLSTEQLLNSQTGEITPITVKNLGEDKIIVRDKPTPSTRYQLITDKFTIDLWYSKNNEWLALNSTTKSGTVLRYKIQ